MGWGLDKLFQEFQKSNYIEWGRFFQKIQENLLYRGC